MRGGRSFLGLAGMALMMAGASMSGMAGALARRAAGQGRKVFGADNISRYIRTYGRTRPIYAHGSIAQGNRHGGPHLHLRERARRLHAPGPGRRAFLKAQQAG